MIKKLGVDIGGTSIKIGVVSAGKVLEKMIFPIRKGNSQKALLDLIINSISRMDSTSIVSLGIGCPGVIDPSGTIFFSPHLPLQGVNLNKVLYSRFKKPIYMDNDANCFVLAEKLFGSAQQYHDIIGVTWGTGIGGGIILGDMLHRGSSNTTELGHISVRYNGIKSACGNRGCLEQTLLDIKGKPSYAELYARALSGSGKALSLWKHLGYVMGVGIANYIQILDPEAVVIGGKVTNAWRFFGPELVCTVQKRTISQNCRLLRSKMVATAGILGAASLNSNVYNKMPHLRASPNL